MRAVFEEQDEKEGEQWEKSPLSETIGSRLSYDLVNHHKDFVRTSEASALGLTAL